VIPLAASRTDGPGGAGARERRRQRTRREIADAALSLAAERGYDHVTVDDIAEAADIAPRTFFRYFPSKDDVLFTDHDEKIAQLRAALAERPEGEPMMASVRAAVLSLADVFEHDRELMVLKSQLMDANPDLRARSLQRQNEWQAVIAEAVARRRGVDPERDLPSQVTAGTTLAALQAAVRVWLAGDEEQSLNELVRDALDLLDGRL
jgi:AcrR family transcriptional regulator